MNNDWVIEAPQDGRHLRRAKFKVAEERDFGRDVSISLTNAIGEYHFVLNRSEMQKLFNELWRYHFRPTENADAIAI